MTRLAILAFLFLGALTAVSALPASFFTLSHHFAPEPGYNPIDDIKSWPDQTYLREHGSRFLQSQSHAESADLRRLVDIDVADEPERRKRLNAAYIVDFGFFACFLVVFVLGFARRHAPQIKETSLNAAADGVRAARTIKSTAQAIGDKIKSRADDRAK